MDVAPIDFTSALDMALINLKVAIAESKAVVTHDDLPIVNSDESKLCQVLQNLIGNAIKFRRTETTPTVHIGAEEKNNEWVFSVKDNGIGIQQEYADRIFVIFQRLHKRDEYPGTGIGLSICKKIIERLGGRIWVESEKGTGTTFLFTIPKVERHYELPQIGQTNRDSIGR